MKCLVVQPIHEDGLAILRAAGIAPVLAPGTDPDILARMVRGCDAVITRDAGFSAAAFEGADRLQVVVVHGTGHDAVNKAAASEKGVLVANTPGVNARSVAEHALALTLALARGVSAADAAERSGTAGFRESRTFTELEGKTALIIGWGAIGSRFGRILDAAFGMRILVHSPHARDIGPYTRAASLEAGLGAADLISLHTPMRADTRHMMNAERFAAVKPGALLVNLARAGLVDEVALDAALGSGRIGGAGLDVYSPGAAQGPLARHGNVIFTPHLGATTEEALSRVARAAAGHVVTALSGGLPTTTLNPELWKAPA
ncbi:MAG: NAD(P)-dependent oxidoreductase [Pseudodonghicola sp.]|nr:NAD(P)-dependent oxidoreductase [Pseudodonghicola sp.]